MEDKQEKLITVQSLVKEVFESMDAYSRGVKVEYSYCTLKQFNARFENISSPTLIHVIPVNGNIYFDGQFGQDEPDTIFAFADLTELDFVGEEHDQVVERMKRLAVDFIEALNKSGYFEPLPERIEYKVPIETMDEAFTGIIINVSLKEVQGLFACGDEDWHRKGEDDNDMDGNEEHM